MSAEFVVSASDPDNLTIYNGSPFQGVSIGDEPTSDEVRRIVVVIGGRGTAARTLDSVTIGGVSADIDVVANNASSGADICAIASAIVPTGVTANIFPTFSGQMIRCGISVFRLINNYALHDFASDTTLTGSSLSASVDNAQNGVIIGGCWAVDGAVSWTNATESDEFEPEGAFLGRVSSALDNSGTAYTGRTITATIGIIPYRGSLALASYRGTATPIFSYHARTQGIS